MVQRALSVSPNGIPHWNVVFADVPDTDYVLTAPAGGSRVWTRKSAATNTAHYYMVGETDDQSTSWVLIPAGAPTFTEVMRQANGTHGVFAYGNYSNGFMCWNRNFATSGASPTENPSGTVWRIRAIGVTGSNTTSAATGITGAFAIQDITSGGFDGYQACFTGLNANNNEGNAAFGTAHTASAAAWSSATWIIERQN